MIALAEYNKIEAISIPDKKFGLKLHTVPKNDVGNELKPRTYLMAATTASERRHYRPSCRGPTCANKSVRPVDLVPNPQRGLVSRWPRGSGGSVGPVILADPGAPPQGWPCLVIGRGPYGIQ